jgi:imidazolonepropionase-like amidohydrolase
LAGLYVGDQRQRRGIRLLDSITDLVKYHPYNYLLSGKGHWRKTPAGEYIEERGPMGNTLISGAMIWDASGTVPFEGDVLIEGNRIRAVAAAPGQIARAGCEVIDGRRLTLMPGMTEGHGHLSFENATCTEDLISPPVEEQTLATARTAKVMLDQGFTSVYGASSAKLRLDVAVRNEIDAGRLPGPRIRAGSLEITVTGGMGDESRLHNPRQGPSIVIDGAEEMRKAVRLCCREGCDNIKLDVSGDPFYPNTPATSTPMALEEVRMAVQTAHSFGRMVNAHARSIASVQRCLEAGVDVLYHCEFADERTFDMLEAAKDRIFVAPTVSLFHTMLYEASPWMRGIRHLIGGDFGFAWSKNGTNARDVGLFVKYFGYSSAEALRCATRNGGLVMTACGGEKLGEIKEGYLADLLLVDGNPLADVSILLNAERLALIVKDGRIYKNSVAAIQRHAAAA